MVCGQLQGAAIPEPETVQARVTLEGIGCVSERHQAGILEFLYRPFDESVKEAGKVGQSSCFAKLLSYSCSSLSTMRTIRGVDSPQGADNTQQQLSCNAVPLYT